MRGRRLQRTRALLFERQPFCVMCGIRLAVIRDHIVPFGAGGSEDEYNIESPLRPLPRHPSPARSAMTLT